MSAKKKSTCFLAQEVMRFEGHWDERLASYQSMIAVACKFADIQNG